MSFTGLLNAEMDVLMQTASADAYGGQTMIASTVYSAKPCRIAQLSMAERAILNREGVESTHRIFANADLTIDTKQECVVGGNVYEVTGWTMAQGARSNHHMEIMVKRQS